MNEKERLERIKQCVKESDDFAEKGLLGASDVKIVNLHNEGHINWLIEQAERVQELERAYKFSADQTQNIINMHAEKDNELIKTQIQNERYREALEYYADYENWIEWEGTKETIPGEVARKALEGTE